MARYWCKPGSIGVNAVSADAGTTKFFLREAIVTGFAKPIVRHADGADAELTLDDVAHPPLAAAADDENVNNRTGIITDNNAPSAQPH